MMKKIIVLILVFAVLSCKKDDVNSSETEILNFTVAPTQNFTPFYIVIDYDKTLVTVLTQNKLLSGNYPVVLVPQIEISRGAIVSPLSGVDITFNSTDDRTKYTITSQNGIKTTDWYVTIRDNQIPNSDFQNWHEKIGMNGKSFDDPGNYEETTVWATANMGTSSYSTYGTTPLTDGNNTLVQIQTGSTTAVPVTSGTLFLGRFDIAGAISNPTNPEAATNFGIPFFLRPVSIRFKYKYQPGAQLVQATLKDPGNIFGGFTVENIAGTDEFKVFAKLEKRDGEDVTVLGELEYTSSIEVSTLTEITLPFTYNSTDMPTHISIVYASSKDGNLYKGAVGSTLVIDDLELIYE